VAAALQMIGTELIRLLAQNAIEGLDEHENRIVHQGGLGLEKWQRGKGKNYCCWRNKSMTADDLPKWPASCWPPLRSGFGFGQPAPSVSGCRGNHAPPAD